MKRSQRAYMISMGDDEELIYGFKKGVAGYNNNWIRRELIREFKKSIISSENT
jgi:hypothetical protein